MGPTPQSPPRQEWRAPLFIGLLPRGAVRAAYPASPIAGPTFHQPTTAPTTCPILASAIPRRFIRQSVGRSSSSFFANRMQRKIDWRLSVSLSRAYLRWNTSSVYNPYSWKSPILLHDYVFLSWQSVPLPIRKLQIADGFLCCGDSNGSCLTAWMNKAVSNWDLKTVFAYHLSDGEVLSLCVCDLKGDPTVVRYTRQAPISGRKTEQFHTLRRLMLSLSLSKSLPSFMA